jgi:phosphoribosylglycinamide formyltransferase-1
MTQTKKRLAILISGRGSNMMSLIAAAREPDYPVEIVCVISNRPEAQGLFKASGEGLPTRAIDHTSFGAREGFEAALDAALGEFNVDLIACAGFMRRMTPGFVERWRDRMLNIHPSLLPAFTGLNTHKRALAAGVKIAGCTVHVVRAEVDCGPIIAQAAVPVLDGDTPETLGARVLEAEHLLYPHALSLFASGAISVSGERTLARQAAVNQAKPLYWPPLD